ncbi:hypothetical protein ART_2515 [Arthrobacter sp. PAMC 25486]|uniref:hypothetical protein n=1 Tax=Arthrobacter sp. PAMC 25486 TaxID=1494608 RepID=UPI000535A760|nr:hypothetical protein [Arthrobacter sp. PAMC 25486]AIY02114.1 hypothetical protein ART_2515 [Arthrobacter sp. PAMC 25486]
MNESETDVWILSFGWLERILFGQIEEQLGKAHTPNPREDSIAWALKYCRRGYLVAGDYGECGLVKWPETDDALEARMCLWLEPDPLDPLGPVMTLMFDLTAAGRALIPEGLRY